MAFTAPDTTAIDTNDGCRRELRMNGETSLSEERKGRM